MPYQQISPHVFNCSVCDTRCDGKTVAQFDFEHDVEFSENIENEVIAFINYEYHHILAIKTTRKGYPDIELVQRSNPNICLGFIEIKGQARTFMSVERILPKSGLRPSETIALNLSDLERYFDIDHQENLPLYIVWCLMGRPCVVGANANQPLFFHQDIQKLKAIRQNDAQDTRRFRRASGRGDVVDGIHKGVTVNYHFSLNELALGLPDLDNLSLQIEGRGKKNVLHK
jgi:hypothetical protein